MLMQLDGGVNLLKRIAIGIGVHSDFETRHQGILAGV
jgi:hypothetical protein